MPDAFRVDVSPEMRWMQGGHQGTVYQGQSESAQQQLRQQQRANGRGFMSDLFASERTDAQYACNTPTHSLPSRFCGRPPCALLVLVPLSLFR